MVTIAAALLATITAARAPAPVLHVTAIPEARDAFERNKALLTAWLGREAGVSVELQVAESYEEAVRQLVGGKADLGWLGGVTLVQAMTRSAGRIRPIVIREKDREFRSYLIASATVGASSVDDLRGKRFAFGSASSTSGHVMPRFFLQSQGRVPEKFFGSVTYTGDHKKTVLAVASGQEDCGAVNFKVFDEMVAEKAVDPAKVKVVWTSPPFTDQAWAAARDLDDRLGAGVLEKIRSAFLRLDHGVVDDRRVLEILKTDKYVTALPEWWRSIGAALQVIKLEPTP